MEDRKEYAARMGRFTFEDLKDIISILRAPDGCPWDREQTHESIKKNFIEETYEAIEAIDTADTELLKEELGDVLLQVALHSEMEAERDNFTIDDVVNGVCDKLVIRHPHIFGDVEAETTKEVLENWDAIKMRTKGQKSASEVLSSVPRSLPALMRAEKIQKKASGVGFDWPNHKGALEKLSEELIELQKAIDNGDKSNIIEEIGDVLFSAVNVARFFDADPEEALTAASDKFCSRFSAVEKSVSESGHEMSDMSLAELDGIWDKVKSGR